MNYKPKYKYIPPIQWEVLTPLYDAFCAVFGLGRGFREKVLRTVTIREDDVVADIGCGTGVFLEVAKRRHPRVRFIGLDPDQKALAIAKRELMRAGLSFELKQAYAELLPLDPQSIDICFSTLAFHHMPNEVKRKAAQEIHRILKPGGVAVIADFGKSKSFFLRKLLFFEKLEYLEGNLNGLIPQYLKEAGFKAPEVVGTHFPGITILKAQKNG